jgi:hypothetical protein
MATRKSTRAGKAQPPSRAKSRNPLSRAAQKAIDEHLSNEMPGVFMGARAALIAAVIAMEGKGVFGDIATSLRMHVLLPLERIELAVTGRGAS